MRLHRHDLRDFKLAFGLAFDLTRLTYCTLALGWTAFVIAVMHAVLSRRDGAWVFDTNLDSTLAALTTGWTPGKALMLACIGAGWWIGFRWICAPAARSAAMDISRDERERSPSIAPLNGHSALSPALGLLVPIAALALAMLWSLVAMIPGTAGAVTAGILLPFVFLAALAGAAFLLVMLAAMPMMTPTAVVEGRDRFEALSRPMSYVMQRPGWYLLAWILRAATVTISGLVGAVVVVGAWGIVFTAMWLIGLGDEPGTALAVFRGEPSGGALSNAIAWVVWGSVALFAAWVLAVIQNSNVILYLLMRYRVDGVPFDAIMIAEEKLAQVKNATVTATEAEEARKRGDEKAETAEPAKAAVEEPAGG